MRWNEMGSDGIRWDQRGSEGMRWEGMRWDGMRWDAPKDTPRRATPREAKQSRPTRPLRVLPPVREINDSGELHGKGLAEDLRLEKRLCQRVHLTQRAVALVLALALAGARDVLALDIFENSRCLLLNLVHARADRGGVARVVDEFFERAGGRGRAVCVRACVRACVRV